MSPDEVTGADQSTLRIVIIRLLTQKFYISVL